MSSSGPPLDDDDEAPTRWTAQPSELLVPSPAMIVAEAERITQEAATDP
ncbi:hypothetical protein [Terrabacter sp. Root181]|nr:hypothetical protein [Terrabacter sp. Root181]